MSFCRTAALILVLHLGLAGCGSGDGQLGTDPSAPAGAPLTAVVRGRALTDQPLIGATVQLLSLQGQELGKASTNSDGIFEIPVAQAPHDFELKAGLGSETYRAVYRDLDSSQVQVMVTPLTHLKAVYQDTYGESEAVVERRFRDYFSIPEEEDLPHHLVIDSGRPGFQVRGYLDQARSQGPEAYAAELVTQVHAGRVPVAAAKFQPRINWSTTASLLGSACANFLAGKPLAGGANVLGWLLSTLLASPDPQVETLKIVQQIAADLAKLRAEVAQLRTDLAQSTLVNPVSVIDTAYRYYEAQDFTLLRQVGIPALEIALDSIHRQLTGEGGLISNPLLPLAVQSAAERSTQADTLGSGHLVGYMLHNGKVLKPLHDYLDGWLTLQTEALQMVVNMHHVPPPSSPTSGAPEMAAAVRVFNRFCRRAAYQLSMAPPYMASDNVIFNPSTGLIFYARVMEPATPQEAQARAATFQEGPYVGWRVMSVVDMTLWLQRGDTIYNQAQGTSTISNTTLQQWGFDISNIGSDRVASLEGPNPFWGVVDSVGNFYNEKYYLGAGGLYYGVNPRGGLDLNFNKPPYQGEWRSSAKLPYVLVCDAYRQPSQLVPALGRMVSLAARWPGNQPAEVRNPALEPVVDTVAASGRAVVLANFSVKAITYGPPFGPTLASFGLRDFEIPEVPVQQLLAWQCLDDPDETQGLARIQSAPSSGPVNANAFEGVPGFKGPFGPGVFTLLRGSAGRQTVTFRGVYANLPLAGPAGPDLEVRFSAPGLGLPIQAGDSRIFQAPSLENVTLFPRKLDLSSTGNQTLHLQGIYSDGSTDDLTTNGTYVVNPPAVGNVVSAQAGPVLVPSASPGVPAGTNFTVTATYQQFTSVMQGTRL